MTPKFSSHNREAWGEEVPLKHLGHNSCSVNMFPIMSGVRWIIQAPEFPEVLFLAFPSILSFLPVPEPLRNTGLSSRQLLCHGADLWVQLLQAFPQWGWALGLWGSFSADLRFSLCLWSPYYGPSSASRVSVHFLTSSSEQTHEIDTVRPLFQR